MSNFKWITSRGSGGPPEANMAFTSLQAKYMQLLRPYLASQELLTCRQVISEELTLSGSDTGEKDRW